MGLSNDKPICSTHVLEFIAERVYRKASSTMSTYDMVAVWSIVRSGVLSSLAADGDASDVSEELVNAAHGPIKSLLGDPSSKKGAKRIVQKVLTNPDAMVELKQLLGEFGGVSEHPPPVGFRELGAGFDSLPEPIIEVCPLPAPPPSRNPDTARALPICCVLARRTRPAPRLRVVPSRLSHTASSRSSRLNCVAASDDGISDPATLSGHLPLILPSRDPLAHRLVCAMWTRPARGGLARGGPLR